MDGITVVDKIVNDKTLNHIPVFILTHKDVTADDMLRMPDNVASIMQKESLDRGKFLSVLEEKLS